MNASTAKRPVASWLIIHCGVWLVGLGLCFIAVRPPLLPEDTRFMGSSLAQVQASVPGLEGWPTKMFTVMGGFMAGAGVLTVALMSATNFALDSDFRWLLLAPAVIWLAGLVLHVTRLRTDSSVPAR